MKFELNDEASFTAVCIALFAAITLIAFAAFRYNAIVYEHGYEQQIVPVDGGFPHVIWVLPDKKNVEPVAEGEHQ